MDENNILSRLKKRLTGLWDKSNRFFYIKRTNKNLDE